MNFGGRKNINVSIDDNVLMFWACLQDFPQLCVYLHGFIFVFSLDI